MSIESRIVTQDVPEHQPGQTSSIGGIGEPRPDSFERYKGFHLEYVDTPGSLGQLEADFNRAKNALESGYTRIQHRAVVDLAVLESHNENAFLGTHVEAIMPLDPTEAGQRPALVYLGWVNEERRQNQADVTQLWENLEIAKNTPQQTVEQMFSRSSRNGFEIRMATPQEKSGSDEVFVQQMLNLYRRFGWQERDVRAILESSQNSLCIARESGQIVSAGLAEQGSIRVEGFGTLRLVEITEAATLNTHQKNGLYTAISTTLLQSLARRSRNSEVEGGQIDVVFGECNGLSQGVLIVSAKQGRVFSPIPTANLGYPYRVLRQQVPIAGVDKNTPYNDLIPTFLTRSKLYEYYGGEN